MAFKKILIAVDVDPIAVRAAEVGIELAGSLQAEVAFVHTIDPMLTYAPDAGVPANELDLIVRRDGQRLMDDIHSRLPAGTKSFDFIVKGAADEEIVKAAREWQADAIVIGSHGRRGITRAFLGSVAEAVLRQAPCPVLIVRGQD